VEKSGRVKENTERLRVLLSGDLDLLDFDDQDARAAGRVRAAGTTAAFRAVNWARVPGVVNVAG